MFKKLQRSGLPLGMMVLYYAACAALVFYLGTRAIGYMRGDTQSTETVVGPTDFVAPLNMKQAAMPLVTEIDFIDTKKIAREVISDVETNWGHLTFSTYGASLERLVLKRSVNGDTQEIATLFPVAQTNRDKHCFLVGMREKTPYVYELVNRVDTDSMSELHYRAITDEADIHKTFMVSKHVHTVQIKLEIVPKGDVSIEPRLIFSSPFIPTLGKKEAIASMLIDRDGVFKKTAYDSIDAQKGWFTPRVFGSEDKYFVHALIGDEQQFTQRAYYSLSAGKDIIAFLEGPTVKKPTTWYLSFYVGPKETKAFAPVDERLEQTLGYSGLLAPLSRLLLHLLQLIYDYVGNYGWAIIILIGLMQLLMSPLTLRTERSSRQAKEFQKKMAYLQLRYKHDKEALAREQALLVKKYGMPGLGGLVSVLFFRMPMFFALQQVLNNAIELYQAPFLWISDLSMPDPYYILPVMVAAAMFTQAYTLDRSQQVQFCVMALIVGAFATTFSAGLALYIAASSVLGAMQSALMRFFKLA